MGAVVVFGATGFLGSRVMLRLSQAGVPCVGVSRRGAMPRWLSQLHPEGLPHASWVPCDTSLAVQHSVVEEAAAVVTMVGSPPVPSVTKAMFDHQVAMSGHTNCNVIDAAEAAGVPRVVLVSASIPSLLQLESFGYHVGKRMARERLRQYAESAEGRRAVAIKPGVLYGTRETESSTVPLTPFLGPVACLHSVASKVLPVASVVDSPVSVDKVADACVHYALTDTPPSAPYLEVENAELVKAVFA